MVTGNQLGHLVVLERDECLDLMATASLGRLAYSRSGILGVIPVNVCLDGEDVYFHLGTGAALRSIYDRDLVTMAIDRFDIERATGWSVNIVGVPREVAQVRHRVSLHGLHSWVRPDAARLFALDTDNVSGRRVPNAS